MRFLLLLVSVYVALVVFGNMAFAQHDDKVALPVSAWLVGPAGVDGLVQSSGTSGDCIMQNEYDNNIRVTFKAKDGKLTALRLNETAPVNVLNNVRGFVGLGIGKNSYALQSRMIDKQLDATLASVPSMAEKMMAISAFRLKLGVNNVYFSTEGFADGYRRLLNCMGFRQPQKLQVVDTTKQLPQEAFTKSEGNMPAEPVGEVEQYVLDDSEIQIKSVEQGGKDVPLAMALPMIVPSDYVFTMDKGTNPMAKVTWEEGGLWMTTLEKAVQPLGYKVFIRAKEIRIVPPGTDRIVAEAETPAPTTETVETAGNDTPRAPVTNDVTVADAAPQDIIQPQTDSPKTDASNAVNVPVAPNWYAAQGRKLSEVLHEWGQREGVNTHIALDSDPVIPQDITVNGSFEMAVNHLLKSVGYGSVMPSAIIKNKDGRITHVAGYQGRSLVGRADGRYEGAKIERWRALEGTDLKHVLSQWSVKEGVDLIWDLDQRFLIKESVKTTVEYPEAVSLLLAQYSGQKTRPVAQLNRDPDTGKTVLIVRLGESS